jgi:hypothetical protein
LKHVREAHLIVFMSCGHDGVVRGMEAHMHMLCGGYTHATAKVGTRHRFHTPPSLPSAVLMPPFPGTTAIRKEVCKPQDPHSATNVQA